MGRAIKNILKAVDRVNRVYPVEHLFLQDVCAAIELQDKAEQRTPSRSYKPSSMNCVRQMYYQIIGQEIIPEGSSASFIGICESGTDRHERLQKAIMEMRNQHMDCFFIDVKNYIETHKLIDLDIIEQKGFETKLFNKKYNIRFMTDGLLRYNKRYYILEIKTETTNKFWKRSGVDPHHISQACAYSLSFGIDQVIFLYENRDTCEKKAYLVEVTPEMIKEYVTDKIEYCNDCVEKKIIPNKTESNLCVYCSYKGICI